MYEIKKKKVEVNGIDFTTFERKIQSNCEFIVEAGTSGYKGKDTRKNSRAMLSIKGLGDISLAAKPLGKKEGCTSGIIVAMSGDSEINAFIKSLKFAVKVLEDQVKEVQD